MLGNRSDARIKQNVIGELKWDSRVDETEIGVSVEDGVVTLTGSVSSFGRKHAAAKAAHRVYGVLDVANEIHVRSVQSSGKSDQEVAQAVRRALEWDVFVPHERIQTTVSEGVVTLSGSVDTCAQKEDAERAIRNLDGVRDALNLIEVARQAAPDKIRKSIEEALGRYAIHEAKGIQANVNDGSVILTGKVRSWAERRAVVGASYGSEGVRHVEDRLEIDPGYSR